MKESLIALLQVGDNLKGISYKQNRILYYKIINITRKCIYVQAPIWGIVCKVPKSIINLKDFGLYYNVYYSINMDTNIKNTSYRDMGRYSRSHKYIKMNDK